MQHITTPTLLLNETICRNNIKKMAEKASQNNVAFRPHMKTHQSAEVGRWMAELGVNAITVSSVKMATYFAEHGWDDITIAFPCNIRQAEAINELAQRVSVRVLINKPATAKRLDEKLTTAVKTYIEVDTGSGRTGLAPENIEEITSLIKVIESTKHISWIGFYSHAGHSYRCRNEEQISRLHQEIMKKFQVLKNHVGDDFGPFEICSGDTPCCSVANSFGPIDAISPGNFVFYDLMQWQIGSCSEKDIAVAMACPVVDKYPERNELVIHGGAVHFSKENIDHNGGSHFGYVAKESDAHWQIDDQSSYLAKLSQEHGTIKCSDGLFEEYDIGDVIRVLPVHSCLTANLMHRYQLADKSTIEMMNV
ncbi:MAG: alanine racemase [Bacteroidota bacterium]